MLFRHELKKVYEQMDYLVGYLSGDTQGTAEDLKEVVLGALTSHFAAVFSGVKKLSQPETKREQMFQEFRNTLASTSHSKRNNVVYLRNPNVAVGEKEIVEAIRFFKVFEQFNVKGQHSVHYNIALSLLVRGAENRKLYDETSSWINDYWDRYGYC